LLIFAILRRGTPRAGDAPQQAVALGPFLTLVGFGPLVLTIVVASLSGAFLLVGWGTTFHVLLTLWLVAVRPLAIEVQPRVLRRAVFASIAVQIVMWGLVTTHGGRLPNLNPTPRQAASPIPAQLADAVREAWRQHCTSPLRFVVTDGQTGAALAVRYGGQPRVVDAMREEVANFFPDEARRSTGAVVVTRWPRRSVPGSARGLMDHLVADAAWQTTVQLPASDGQMYTYVLGVLPPVTGHGCDH